MRKLLVTTAACLVFALIAPGATAQDRATGHSPQDTPGPLGGADANRADLQTDARAAETRRDGQDDRLPAGILSQDELYDRTEEMPTADWIEEERRRGPVHRPTPFDPRWGQAEDWRSVQHEGRWWYWTPYERWLYYDNGDWQAYNAQPQSAARRDPERRVQTGFRGVERDQQQEIEPYSTSQQSEQFRPDGFSQQQDQFGSGAAGQARATDQQQSRQQRQDRLSQRQAGDQNRPQLPNETQMRRFYEERDRQQQMQQDRQFQQQQMQMEQQGFQPGMQGAPFGQPGAQQPGTQQQPGMQQQPGQPGTTPGQEGAQPGQTGTRPGEGAQPGQTGTQPGAGAQPGQTGTQSGTGTGAAGAAGSGGAGGTGGAGGASGGGG